MATTCIDWSTAAIGRTVVPALTIAGCPYLIIPGGTTVTAVAWTADPDSGWALGTSPTTRDWLQLGMWRIECQARLPGDVPDVSGLTIDLTDVDRAVTAYLGGRGAMARTLLAATCEATDTSLVVERTDGFTAVGGVYVLHVGGERMTATGVASGPARFTGLTRGTAGTRARRHVRPAAGMSPEVFGGSTERLPTLRGRRAMLWLLSLVGTTATDPTLIFDGVCGAGAEVDAGWSLPLVPSVRALESKLRTREVSLTGWVHDAPAGLRRLAPGVPAPPPHTPLAIYWDGALVLLTDAADTIDTNGVHPTRESFFRAFQEAADGIMPVGSGLDVALTADKRLTVYADAPTDQRIYLWAPWIVGANYVAVPSIDSADTAVRYEPADPVPACCLWLDGHVPLTAADLALVPAVPGTLDAASHTAAWWTLTADAGPPGAEPAAYTAKITAVDTDGVTCAPYLPTRDGAWVIDPLVTRPQRAGLRLAVTSDTWWDALRYGVLGAIDAAEGTGQLADTVDWSGVATVAARDGAGPFTARHYHLTGEESLIDLLVAEGAGAGLSLATVRGRLGFVRLADVAATEPAVATITTRDLASGSLPRPQWSLDGCATSYVWELPAGTTLRVLDAAAEDEGGQGRTITAKLPPGSFDAETLPGPAMLALCETIGAQVLGPIRREYQEVALTLPLHFAGIEIGDTVRVTEYVAAPGDGTRGLVGAACVVTGKVLEMDWPAGRGAVELTARVSTADATGYAPGFLVAAGGITGAVLTADATNSVALDGRSVVDGFAAGDKVLLHEYDSASPATPWQGTVASVDTIAGTITLTGSPPAGWATLAASALKVMVAFDEYANATQRAWAFVATSGALLDGTDAPKRFAG